MAGIGLLFQSVEQLLREFPGVAQAKVETLSGDRVQRLRRVANPHLARLNELPAYAQGERVGGAWSCVDEIEARTELHAQGGEEASIVEREEVFGLLRRHSEHHRVVLAERQQRQRAVGREALPGAIAVRRRGADFGDHRVLAVVTDADFGVALRRAFGVDDEFGRDLLRGVTTRDRHQGIAVVGADADDIARRQPLLRRNTRVERRCEVAVAHDVAERRRAVVGSVDHRTAEAAALRYVDFLDRCAGGCVPRAQAFEQLPAAVRERQAAWVVGPDAARAAVEQMDALAPVSEC